ncbi:hypothetical protein QM467_13010 [Rhodoblastus sp. 17X3]|uniref:hypothetical protein n=1 Tax=Rhodoblastus sp. 17X3 TaxID=3047026 RepID=UPI0024B699AF|nr:hypothetical protein [Rhodoblastus sp. 17X3]MDI9848976.1 hypothetical protein [Rhodoblastus sp. 17X3]
MAKATKHADRPHARIYAHWLELPAWLAIRREAQLLLVHMLCDYRPAKNSRLEWSLTRVQKAVGCSRTIASESLTDLEKNGWLAVCRVGRFSGSRQTSLYRLTMFPSEVEGLPKTEEFLRIRNPARPGRNKNRTGFNKTPDKSLLKPQQVLVETANGKIPEKTAAKPKALIHGKNDLFPPQTNSEPVALGTLATQLLSASGFAGLGANDCRGAAREALRSAAAPPLAPSAVRNPVASNRRRF